MLRQDGIISYSFSQTTILVILRVLIGWHFLYEGLIKVLNPYWTSAGFLLESKGFLSGFYKGLANSPGTLGFVDFMNEWGLVLIGLGLILGILTRPATIAGIILLALYYLATPPFIGLKYSIPSEGSYFLVNKNLIELFALSVLYVFPTGKIIGLDRLIFNKQQ